jgi:hypothetical protein
VIVTYFVKKCLNCGTENHPDQFLCTKCERMLGPQKTESNTKPVRLPEPPEPAHDESVQAIQPRITGNTTKPSEVRIVDINMPFASMVGFMVKWALAAIPAAIILLFVLDRKSVV